MKEVCNKYQCCGCTACKNICPKECITMKSDEEGFLYPIIDRDKCIDCNSCVSVCQAHTKTSYVSERQKYYAVKNTEAIRAVSSSGGVFTAISDYVITNKGVVAGAAFNEKFLVSHRIVTDIEGRNQLRGTKYTQSDLNGIFIEIKKLLIERKKVLFVGTPCQVEGLNLFLKNKFDNLITCDLICHGVSSPIVFESFIDYIQKKVKSNLVNFNFRDKNLGWRGYKVSAEFKNKKINNKLWLRSFNYLFSQNYINRPSCAQCKFCSYNRCSDLTIGDYWGIEKYYPKFDDNLGVSLVMTNTYQGESLYQSICQNLEQIEIKKEETNQNSLRRPPKKNKKRNEFWENYQLNGYKAAIKKYGEYNLKGFIKDLIRKLLDINALRKLVIFLK